MIIANNCIGAYCYRSEDSHRPSYEYDNPFIGNLILENSFYKILKYFESIDWKNPKYCKGIVPYLDTMKTYNYVSLMDDEIRIYFRHYSFDNMISHWEERTPRMLEFMKTPDWKNKTLVSFRPYYYKLLEPMTEMHYQYRVKIFEELRTEWKLVISCDEYSQEYDNIIHTPFKIKYKHTSDVSEWIYENYQKYITNEWD